MPEPQKYYRVNLMVVDRREITSVLNYDVSEINANNPAAFVMIGIRNIGIGNQWDKKRSILIPWHNIRDIAITEVSE